MVNLGKSSIHGASGVWYDLPNHEWLMFGKCKLDQSDPLWQLVLATLNGLPALKMAESHPGIHEMFFLRIRQPLKSGCLEDQ